MGEIVKHRPVLLIAAVTSRYLAALDWTVEKTSEAWGEVALRSPVYDSASSIEGLSKSRDRQNRGPVKIRRRPALLLVMMMKAMFCRLGANWVPILNKNGIKLLGVFFYFLLL